MDIYHRQIANSFHLVEARSVAACLNPVKQERANYLFMKRRIRLPLRVDGNTKTIKF